MAGDLGVLAGRMAGPVQWDRASRLCYSTDASLYQEEPLGVAFPRNTEDLREICRWAVEHQVGLIPRSAGTSLAGQCVGHGLVVDVSRFLTDIRSINADAHRAVVAPGVIQDDLNDAVRGWGLEFGPDTSTSDRCMIGGMIGNNACGAHSIVHGTTREHVLTATVVLADGSLIRCQDLSESDLAAKRQQDDREGAIYRELDGILRENSSVIRTAFPAAHIVRRNTGYALDSLAACHPYTPGGPPFNLCRLLCGSEGTLGLVAEAEVNLVPRDSCRLLLTAHFHSIDEACRATVMALEHRPVAVELIDAMIITAASGNPEAQRHCRWIEGEPGAVLGIEFGGSRRDELLDSAAACVERLQAAGLGYAYPVLEGADHRSVWAVRKAGLGLLMGVPGDAKTVTMIEDAAVAVTDLADYVQDIGDIMAEHGLQCCHYGHASVGLLHLRPEIDLRSESGRSTFTAVAAKAAALVRRYDGSLSGEHGDGRLRAPFLAEALGPEVLELMRRVKAVFDPDGIFNPGKIFDAPAIDQDLRVDGGPIQRIETAFDWSAQLGFQRATEQCNGAGVCRRSPGRGTMCPSYQASGDERLSTRGRANLLRRTIEAEGPEAAWADSDLADTLSLCLSCKACASECPSSVDMARLKAEWQHQRHQRLGVSRSERLVGDYHRQGGRASRLAALANAAMALPVVKRLLGVDRRRSLPRFHRQPFRRLARRLPKRVGTGPSVALLVDHFVDWHEPSIAVAALRLLLRAGFSVTLVTDWDDGRTFLSKGLLDDAALALRASVFKLKPLVDQGMPLVGLEPSAALGFRDEAPDLLRGEDRAAARQVAERVQLFEEFVDAHRARFAQLPFRSVAGPVLIHGHCHQKTVVGDGPTERALGLLPDADVQILPTGCCGMAGHFGYEHMEPSRQVAELVLFPALRARPEALVCAPGTSCRHQIADGLGRRARHTAQILADHLPVAGSGY